ncbi:MAG TPA: glycosyl amidation-associated protein WbuZ [Oculatellaceae cyanobacterium]
MLKTRVIPVVLFNGAVVVKSVRFENWRNIGHPVNVARVYNAREVDELIFLDIVASRNNRRPDVEMLRDIVDECFMPLTVGGGIRQIDDIKSIVQAGADKISLNTAALDNPGLITEAANKFGSQCVVVSIDVKRDERGDYRIYKYTSKQIIENDPFAWARQLQEMGAGEILLTSVDQDGTMESYDVELIERMANAVSVPVIAAGGAGELDDFVKARQAGASAVAAASIFHFTQHTPLEAKAHMKLHSIEVRL